VKKGILTKDAARELLKKSGRIEYVQEQEEINTDILPKNTDS